MEIKADRLWISRVYVKKNGEVQRDRLPTSVLSPKDGHVHGELRITIQDELVPQMGHFGPDEVCLGEWMMVLSHAYNVLCETNHGRYLYDGGEQGQPAYLFERVGDSVFVEVVDPVDGDGVGSPEWGRRRCSVDEFLSAILTFFSDFEAQLERDAPGVGGAWVRERNHIKSLSTQRRAT